MADILVPENQDEGPIAPVIGGLINCPVCLTSLHPDKLCNHLNHQHNYILRNRRRTVEEGYRTLEEINSAIGLPIQQWYQCDKCLLFCKGTRGLNMHNNRKRNRGLCEDPRIQEIVNNAAEVEIPPVANPAEIIDEAVVNGHNNMDINLPEAEYRNLAANFRLGAYNFHISWKEPLLDILVRILKETIDDDPAIAAKAILALQLLPGMLELCRRAKNLMSVIEFLRKVRSSQNPHIFLIKLAVEWKSKDDSRPANIPKAITIHGLKSRIERLIAQGRISTAERLITNIDNLQRGVPNPPPITDEEFSDKVNELYPIANEFDVLPPPSDDPHMDACLQLDAHEVRHTILGLKTNKSAGSTGWTYNLLVKICEDRHQLDSSNPPNPIHPIFHSFALFFNRIIRGEYVGICAELLFRKKLILINKTDRKLRPLGMLDSLYRTMAKALHAKAIVYMGDSLRPLQFGCGMKGGVQMSIKHSELAILQGDSIITADCSNAFNTIRLSLIYEGLKTYCPGLIKLFRSENQTPSIIENHKGSIVGYTETGATQGHIMGPFYFAVGAQAMIIEIDNKKKDIEREFYDMNQDIILRPGSFTKACADDIAINGHPTVMAKLAVELPFIYESHHLSMNVAKSNIAGFNLHLSETGIPADFQFSHEGIVVLGYGIGTAAYKDKFIEEKIRGYTPLYNALATISKAGILQLTTKCYNNRASFIFSLANDITEIAKHTHQYDQSIIRIIADNFSLPIDSLTQQPHSSFLDRIFLPRCNAGLGLNRHHGLRTECAIISTLLQFKGFIEGFSPSDVLHTLNFPYVEGILPGNLENLIPETQLTVQSLLSLTPQNSRAILKTASKKAYNGLAAKIAINLATNPNTRSQAAWFLSSGSGNSSPHSFIDSCNGSLTEHFFSQQGYVDAIRNIIGLGAYNTPSNVPILCSCGNVYTTEAEPTHCFHCYSNGPSWTRRHTALSKLLVTFIRSCKPNAIVKSENKGGTKVGQRVINVRNVNTGLIESKRVDVFADIVVEEGPERLILDLLTVDPSAPMYNKPHLTLPRAYNTVDAAAIIGERKKKYHYGRVSLPAPLPPESIIPFVTEATGRLGPSALAYITKICPTQTYRRSKFLKSVSLLCARYTGQFIKTSRDPNNAYPQNGAL